MQFAMPSIQQFIEILSFAMVTIALGIISIGSVQRMIQLYQIQSLLLALLTVLIAFEPGGFDRVTRMFLVAFAVLIPGALAYIIEPLLAQATVPREETRWMERLGHPFLRLFSRRYREEANQSIREALPVWLVHGLSPPKQIASAVVSLALTGAAYFIAFNLISGEAGTNTDRPWRLAVSLTLLMLGIFTMINRQDLISQIIGLLVMDHGLFLAVIRLIYPPSLIPTFVISLLLYILITLLILVILLPELHERSQTIEVADQNTLKG